MITLGGGFRGAEAWKLCCETGDLSEVLGDEDLISEAQCPPSRTTGWESFPRFSTAWRFF